jgi:peptidoglycan/LPS O-acetylase OafA/YrhL
MGWPSIVAVPRLTGKDTMQFDPQKTGRTQAEPDRRAASVRGRRTPGDIAPNINAVRGLACLLIVALHVVGDEESNGLQLAMTSNWHYAMQSIEFLRIPLFTALSGYLYGGRRVTLQALPRFWTKKLRRLGTPLLFVTIVMWWLRTHALADGTSLPTALLFEYGHLWYLQSLLILFTGISIADAFFEPGFVGLVLAGLLAIMVSQSGVAMTTFFGTAGAFYLAPYFFFGIILRERPEWLRDPRAGVLAFGIIVIVLTSQQFGMFGITNTVTLLQLPAAIAGMAGVVLLLQRFPRYALLSRVGHYSYTIYLWHVLAGAAVRDALLRTGVTTIPGLFLCSLTAGIAAPIVIYYVARRIPLLSVAVTGDRWLGADTALRAAPAGAIRS